MVAASVPARKTMTSSPDTHHACASPERELRRRRRTWRTLSLALVVSAAGVLPVSAGHAASLDGKVESTRTRIAENESRQEAVGQRVDSLGEKASTVKDEIAGLVQQEAGVEDRLQEKTAELDRLQAELAALERRMEKVRGKLSTSRDALAKRLVAAYKTDRPDAVTVVLEGDGFNDLLERTAYLGAVSEQNQDIVVRTRRLREEVSGQRARVAEIEQRVAAVVNEVRERRDQLVATREAREVREGRLAAARQGQQGALSRLEDQNRGLAKELRALEAEQAAVAAQLASTAGTVDPGPIKGGSGELIWPVNGSISSPFGPRWGRLHAGIDVPAPAGTPIRAAAPGSVIIAGVQGGYGNYTCIQHARSLSTCYAHQLSIGVSVGQSVDQGDVIGAVGNTGASFGDHLHFETRIDGTPQDPMAYL